MDSINKKPDLVERLDFITSIMNLSKITDNSIKYEDKNFKISITRDNHKQNIDKPSEIAVENINDAEDYLTGKSKPTISHEKIDPPNEGRENLHNLNVIKSDIVGTVYLAPSPNANPFVKIGSNIKYGESLCIIECMKVMNTIESEYEGEVHEIHVSNGDIVEYNQPLFTIKGNKS